MDQQDIELVNAIAHLESGNIVIQTLLKQTENTLNKRALSVAATHLETAQLWLANSRPD